MALPGPHQVPHALIGAGEGAHNPPKGPIAPNLLDCGVSFLDADDDHSFLCAFYDP